MCIGLDFAVSAFTNSDMALGSMDVLLRYTDLCTAHYLQCILRHVFCIQQLKKAV